MIRQTLLLMGLVLAFSGEALGKCGDPPRAGVDWSNCTVSGVNYSGVDLSGAKIGKANMTGADLSGATWIDGETICAEGSIGQCNRAPKASGASG